MPCQDRVKDHIRQRFSRAAQSYDQYAHVQRLAAEWLMATLKQQPATILEIGCGTGNLTKLLAARFPDASITSLDFAQTMVDKAREKMQGVHNIAFHCVDGEIYISNTAELYDLVISNATLQWFTDLPRALANLSRIISKNGRIALSLFGPRSFQELGAAMREVVGPDVHLPAESFCAAKEAESLAGNVFQNVDCVSKIIEKKYATFFDILDHIKKTGTGGYHDKVPHLSRSVLQSLDQWFIENGGYVISYEIAILTCHGVRQKDAR